MSFGFSTGLRGLQAARLAMQVIGQNVANINTPGFSRQRVLLGSTFPVRLGNGALIGSGVDIETVQRVLDGRLEARIRSQNSLFGSASVDYYRMTEVEGILGEPGNGGLSSLFNDFFGSVSKLRSDPGERSLRGGIVQAGRGLAGGFNLLANRLDTLQTDSFRDVQALTKQANEHAAQIAELNRQIISLEATGHKANDLRDHREQAIKELSTLIDVRALDRKNGSVDVLAGGHLYVSGANNNELNAIKTAAGKTEIRVGGTTTATRPTSGKIAALLRGESGYLPGLRGKIDELARTFSLEINRIHTTGMAKNGPFTSLVADTAIVDGDLDGDFADEILGFGGLPFEVKNGSLWIAVTELDTGNVERTRIDIDPKSMTLGDLATQIGAIDRLTASVDPTGRLRINAQPDYGFDFSARLDSAPDVVGTFAGASATIGGSKGEPFVFSSLPADFQIEVDGGAAQTITLTATDFGTPSAVTAKELAKVLNTKFQSASLAVTAHEVGGHLSLKSGSTGVTSSLRVTDGTNTPASLIGLPTGVTVTGQALGVAVAISGSYEGDTNDRYRFVAEGDGQIGVTAGLTVGVYDQSGTKVATLDVGKGYSPSHTIEVANGVKVTFGPGSISKTAGHQLALDTLADPDTSDALVALGLNTFFRGANAADLAVVDRIADDPDLLAAGLSLLGNKKSAGDGSNLARIEALRDRTFDALTGSTMEDFWTSVASDVGFEARKSEDLLVSQDELRQFLLSQRESVSGVNIDEEMVDLVRYQQAFQASSRFINMMNEMSQTLIQLGR